MKQVGEELLALEPKAWPERSKAHSRDLEAPGQSLIHG